MTPPRRRRSWLLPISATLLLALVPLRAVEFSQGWRAIAAEAPAQGEKVAAPAALASPPAEQQADAGLLVEIARRGAQLDQREHAISLREAQVAATTQLAEKQLAELRRMRQSVEGLVVHEAAASTADMKLLIGLYSNMKPTQAATVLSRLDPPKAAEILQNLETDTAGPILAAMDTAAAVKVTEELQQRRAAFRE